MQVSRLVLDVVTLPGIIVHGSYIMPSHTLNRNSIAIRSTIALVFQVPGAWVPGALVPGALVPVLGSPVLGSLVLNPRSLVSCPSFRPCYSTFHHLLIILTLLYLFRVTANGRIESSIVTADPLGRGSILVLTSIGATSSGSEYVENTLAFEDECCSVGLCDMFYSRRVPRTCSSYSFITFSMCTLH